MDAGNTVGETVPVPPRSTIRLSAWSDVGGSRAGGSDPLPATPRDLLVARSEGVKHGGDLGGEPPVLPQMPVQDEIERQRDRDQAADDFTRRRHPTSPTSPTTPTNQANGALRRPLRCAHCGAVGARRPDKASDVADVGYSGAGHRPSDNHHDRRHRSGSHPRSPAQLRHHRGALTPADHARRPTGYRRGVASGTTPT